tara:strand:- start:19463 stop:20149 length:687 start_codon:yes stop_codon:yes gene_type:complete
MTAFDTTWDLLKDFYFSPKDTKMNVVRRDDGSVLSFADRLGEMQPPMIDADYMRRITRGSDFKPIPSPFVEGKHQPVILPRNVVMEHDPEEGGFAPRRIDSMRMREMYRGHEGLPHYVGVNLSAMRQGEDDLDTILETLAHEHAHAAIDDELMQVLYDRMVEAQNYDDAEKAYHQHVGAHEIGAYNLQNPGGEDAARSARFSTILHPNYKLANRGKSPPMAYIRDNLK